MIMGLRSIISGAAGAVAGGMLVYLAMMAREMIVVDGAVQAERNRQVSLCEEDKRVMRDVINTSVSNGVRVALEAAGRLDPAPEEHEALMALCKRSSSCWEREEMP